MGTDATAGIQAQKGIQHRAIVGTYFQIAANFELQSGCTPGNRRSLLRHADPGLSDGAYALKRVDIGTTAKKATAVGANARLELRAHGGGYLGITRH